MLTSILGYSGLYRPIRSLRTRFLRTPQWNAQLAWRQLYAPFIRRGALVFDIGANRGDRTESFLALGARVAAVEPNPELAARLSAIYRWSPVTVVEAAVGENEGQMPMYLSSHSNVSSLSEEWIRTMKAGHLSHVTWNREVTVTVITVEELRRKFGEPDFVKIDVEGFERSVLRGVRHKIRALSFEAHGESLDHAAECVELLKSLGEYRFNILLGEEPKLVLENWIAAGEVIGTLRSRYENGGPAHSDIFAVLA